MLVYFGLVILCFIMFRQPILNFINEMIYDLYKTGKFRRNQLDSLYILILIGIIIFCPIICGLGLIIGFFIERKRK
jgi:hypothetical protein